MPRRLRLSALSGELSASASNSTTTLSSPEFAGLPEIVDDVDYMALIIDPEQVGGPPEIVWVTAHTAADTDITVLRGQEQAHGAPAGRAHASGITWNHGPTAGEFIGDVLDFSHTTASDPIPLNTPVVTVVLGADVEAFTPGGEMAEVVLILLQGGGSAWEWTSNTGINVVWATGSAPTLCTTTGHFDMIRLTRLASDSSTYIGRVEVADAATS